MTISTLGNLQPSTSPTQVAAAAVGAGSSGAAPRSSELRHSGVFHYNRVALTGAEPRSRSGTELSAPILCPPGPLEERR